MLIKGLFRGGDDSGSESSSSHSGGGGRRESALGKVARVLLPNAGRRDRGNAVPYFNPEEHISQKREWSRRYTQQELGAAGAAGGEDRLYEHFAVVGLPPNMNIREVAADIKTYQRLNRAAGSGGSLAAAAGGLEVTADTPREERQRQYGLKGPALQGEVLYTLPSAPAMAPDLAQSLAAFCFPHGVRPELLERTPSMSALNEVIYSQPYQTHDDHSFVFLMKVSDPGSVAPRTLFGVCCYVRELVHRPPSMARAAYPGCNAPLSRYLVVAPRCYCLLTHHPFFALHFRVLQTILGLERLERMTSFAAELAGLDSQLSPAASPAHTASSLGAQPAASTGSVNQPAAAVGAAAAPTPGARPAAAAGPAVGGAAGEAAAAEEEGSEGSSRRWTEGSGPDEPQLAAPGSLAGALQQLGLSEGGLPSRRAQVSPRYPALPGPAEAHAPPAGTPTDQGLPASAAGPTPFFTPAATASAAASPATHAREGQQHARQVHQAGAPHASLSAGGELAAAPPTGSAGASPPGDPRRTLVDVLAEVGSSGSSPAGPAGMSPGLGGVAVGRPPVTDAELAAEAGSRSSSRAGSRQQRAGQRGDEDDGSASDAESYLTASSSTALLAPQSPLDGSPLPLGVSGRLSQASQEHARSLSASSVASLCVAGASPLAAGRAGLTTVAAAAAALAAGERGQEPQEAALLVQLDRPPAFASPIEPCRPLQQQQAADAPLLDLGTEALASLPKGLQPPYQQQQQQQQQQQEQQQRHGCCPADPPPLVQLDEGRHEEETSDERQQQQQQQQHQGGLPADPPLVELPGELEPAPQHEKQQPHAGWEVQVVTSVSSRMATSAAAAAASTPPRADLLGGDLLLTGDSQHAPPPPADLRATAGTGGQQGAEQQGERRDQHRRADVCGMPPLPPHPPRQQEGQAPGVGEQQVVRVTARNLDLSRPLCSADLLAVYRCSVVPQPGQLFEFQPDPGLQTICFKRPDLLRSIRELGLRPSAASLPDIDAAENLSGWAVAALCRSMSLDSLLTFLTAALLERQIVVFCPNAGLLSGIVLSLIPLLLPFHWQCLLLPVLPAGEGRLELMEAPVPFVLGVLYKTSDVRGKCGGLVRVNVYKDKVKNAGGLPPLPQQAALMDALAGTHAELRRLGLARAAAMRPVHVITDKQQAMAEGFLATLKRYLQGLVADLRAYCITDVSSTMERTSVLLKDSFVESFPPRDRPFMRQFAETQMFSVYCDAVI